MKVYGPADPAAKVLPPDGAPTTVVSPLTMSTPPGTSASPDGTPPSVFGDRLTFTPDAAAEKSTVLFPPAALKLYPPDPLARNSVLPVLAPVKRVNAAPPVANVYVVVPTPALSFATPPTVVPDTFTVSGDVELVATAEKSMASPTPVPVWTKLSLPLPARKVFCPAAEPVTDVTPVIASDPPVREPAHRCRVGRQVDRDPRTPDVAAEKSAALPLPVASKVYPPVDPDTKVVSPPARPSKTLDARERLGHRPEVGRAGCRTDLQRPARGKRIAQRVPGETLSVNVSAAEPASKVVPPLVGVAR